MKHMCNDASGMAPAPRRLRLRTPVRAPASGVQRNAIRRVRAKRHWSSRRYCRCSRLGVIIEALGADRSPRPGAPTASPPRRDTQRETAADIPYRGTDYSTRDPARDPRARDAPHPQDQRLRERRARRSTRGRAGAARKG